MSFLPYPAENTSQAIALIKQDGSILHNVVHGDENADVLTENGLVPSLAKTVQMLVDEVEAATGVDVSLRSDLASNTSNVLVGGIYANLISAHFNTVSAMLAYPNHVLGKIYSTGGTVWEVVDDYGVYLGSVGLYARAITDIQASDYMTTAHYKNAESATPTIDSTAILQQATNDAFLCKCNVILSTVFLLKGGGGTVLGRLTDGVDIKSGVSYYGIRRAEVRLDLSSVIGFAHRPHVALTNLSQAPVNVNFYGIKFTRPSSSWDVNLQNTALLYIAAVNGMKVTNCAFIGWVGDAIYFGLNDDPTLSAALDTYIRNVEVTSCYFDGVNNGNRQAISILDGVDMHIHHNIFKNCTRTELPDPMPGAIDIEPLLTSAQVANIIIENNLFDGVGGATGVVSAALSHPTTLPAHDIRVRFNTFRNTKCIADFYAFGPTSTNHTSLPTNAPYGISFTDNVQEDLPVGVQSRRWFAGGVKNLNIDRNEVIGGSDTAIIGYDDSVNKWPVENLSMKDNIYKNWIVAGDETTPSIGFFGGILGAIISDNNFTNCGNKSGSPVNMTCYSFRNNAVSSKNVVMVNDTFVNTGLFSASSHPIHAPTLTNAQTFVVHDMNYLGINSTAYTYDLGIYNKAITDFHQKFVVQPSTVAPVVAGLSKIVGNTGDTWTNFLGGQDGQELTIVSETSGIVITNNSNIILKSGANVTLIAGKVMKLVCYANKWYEL